MKSGKENDKFGEKLPLPVQLSITLGSIAFVVLLLYIVYCIFKYKKGACSHSSEIENEINFSGKSDSKQNCLGFFVGLFLRLSSI